MDRRTFLIRSAWLTAGGILASTSPTLAKWALKSDSLRFDSDLYNAFKERRRSTIPSYGGGGTATFWRPTNCVANCK